MSKRKEYEEVGNIKVLRQKPPKKPDYDWVWGVIALTVIVLLIFGPSVFGS